MANHKMSDVYAGELGIKRVSLLEPDTPVHYSVPFFFHQWYRKYGKEDILKDDSGGLAFALDEKKSNKVKGSIYCDLWRGSKFCLRTGLSPEDKQKHRFTVLVGYQYEDYEEGLPSTWTFAESLDQIRKMESKPVVNIFLSNFGEIDPISVGYSSRSNAGSFALELLGSSFLSQDFLLWFRKYENDFDHKNSVLLL